MTILLIVLAVVLVPALVGGVGYRSRRHWTRSRSSRGAAERSIDMDVFFALSALGGILASMALAIRFEKHLGR